MSVSSVAIKKISLNSLAPIALAVCLFGVYGAIRSQSFLVHVVEITGESQITPVDSNVISNLVGIKSGKVSLFDLDLVNIERRIRTNPWVNSVRLEKRFPQTLSIHVDYRKPIALLQKEGALLYLDSQGTEIERMSLRFQSNLPLVSGVDPGTSQFQQALSWIQNWASLPLYNLASIDSVSLDPDEGFQLQVRYKTKEGRVARARIHMGDADISSEQWHRLAQVMTYLSQNQIRVSDIHADLGKKIVVKTSTGS